MTAPASQTDEAPAGHAPASRALDRFTVLDLTRARAGPTAARCLADWGANVLKIERPGGDYLGFGRHGSDFQNLQRHKRSVTLDLKSAEGVAVFKRLAARADVLIENYRPEVKERLGIDYESLKAVNPRLVYASVSGFGQDGPYRDRPGLDQIAQGMGGLMSITGLPGQGPVRAGIPLADLSAGLFCALGILVALLEREVSGQGQWVQTSLLEAQIAMLDFQAVRWLIDGKVPPQAGNDHPTSIPTGAFPTADGMINIAASGQVLWERLCHAIEGAHLLQDPDFADDRLRSRHRARLNAELAALLRRRPSADWIEILNAAGVPCGPINRIDQVFADPQVRHLGMSETVAHPTLGPLALLRQPVRLSRTPSHLRQAAPELGADTEAVLRAVGFADDEIADLARRGVI